MNIKNLFRKNKILILVSILVCLLILVKSIIGTGVIAYQVKKQEAVEAVTATGAVTSVDDVDITSQVTAKIVKLYAKTGTFVSKGDVLVVLDNIEAKAKALSAEGDYMAYKAQYQDLITEPRVQNLKIAKAHMEEAKRQVNAQQEQVKIMKIRLKDIKSQEDRFKKLEEQGAISFREFEVVKFDREEQELAVELDRVKLQSLKHELEQAIENYNLVQEGTKKEVLRASEAKMLSAKANLQSKLAELDYYTIKAPMDGYIVSVPLRVGDLATPNKELIRLVVSNDLFLKVDVEEDQLKGISEGQNAYVVFDAYPDEVFKSKVFLVVKDVDPVTGTFQVRVRIPDAKDLDGKSMIAGMNCDVSIVTEESNSALVIPKSFVTVEKGKFYVFLKKGRKSVKKEVFGEMFNNSKFRVFKGVNEKDLVLSLENKNKKLTNNKIVYIKKMYKE